MNPTTKENFVARLARFSIERRVTMSMIFLTIVAVGFIAVDRLQLEMNPKGLEGDELTVRADWNVGVPPETMDKIGIPLEEELSTVGGVEEIETSAYRSGARVELEFKPGTDMDVAYREVRDRVERARPLFPEGVDKPRIYKRDESAEPVVGFRISYPPDTDYYDLINKYVITPIQRIPGVADVEFRIYQREVRIEVDKDRAEAYGINIQRLSQILQADNMTVASGTVIDGGKKYALKSESSFETMQEIQSIPVSTNVFLSDIATLSYEPEEQDRMYRYNGQPANGIQVNKESEANTVAVSKAVEETIEEIKKNPKLAGFEMSVYDNQGADILVRLKSLINNGKVGALMAGIVLFFFLRQFRLTLVISMAIPLCLLIALTVMFFYGQTLNRFTIMGLVICVGLLVDNSVVVAENIHRHFQNGLSRKNACLKGVQEIGFAIMIATMTTLIVFMSAMLADGEMRFMIENMSLPVISAIIASLGTALMFIPLCVFMTLPKRSSEGGNTEERKQYRPLAYIYDNVFERFNRFYNTALKVFLKRRLDLAIIVITLFSITWMVAQNLNTTRRQAEQIRKFDIEIRFPDDYSMDERLAFVQRCEAVIQENNDVYGLRAYEAHYAKWYARLGGFFAPDREAELTREEAIAQLYEDLPEVPGVIVRRRDDDDGRGRRGNPNRHYVRVVGSDPDVLKQVVQDLKPEFESIPGVLQVLDRGADEAPSEMALYVDRQMASSIGVNTRELAGTVGAAVRGESTSRFNNKGRQVPIRLLFEEEDRADVDDVYNFQVPAEDGRVSTIGALTRTEFLKNEDGYIRREDRKITEFFGIQLEPGPDTYKTKMAIEAAKSGMSLPEGVSFDEVRLDFGDDDRKKGASMLLVAVLFVYMLMAFFFESLLIPLAIILTVPLAAIGAILALKISDIYIDGLVYTGALLLVGIVVNNGIVLIDYANRLRSEGMERAEALLTAARHRFRPIIMTALTTICGMIPLTFGSSEDMGMNFSSFGMVLIGGMISATLFTLLTVPVFFTIIEDAQTTIYNIMAGVFGKSSSTKEKSSVAPAPQS